MKVETIINGKRMLLPSAMPFVEIAFAPDAPSIFKATESDPFGPIQPVTIQRQRHRLVRLVAEYELDGVSY